MATNPNGMVSLVSFLGDEKIKFQVMHKCATSVSLKRNHSKVAFETEQDNIQPADLMTGKPNRYGILIWVDREDFEAWQNRGSTP